MALSCNAVALNRLDTFCSRSSELRRRWSLMAGMVLVARATEGIRGVARLLEAASSRLAAPGVTTTTKVESCDA